MSLHRQNQQSEQSRVELWHMFATVQAGNAIARTMNASQLFGHYASQTAAAQNDDCYHLAYLKAGTYELRMIYLTSASGGIIDLYVNGEEDNVTHFSWGTDAYSAVAAFSQILVKTVTLTRDQLYRIRMFVPTRNAASGGYQQNITAIFLWKTG